MAGGLGEDKAGLAASCQARTARRARSSGEDERGWRGAVWGLRRGDAGGSVSGMGAAGQVADGVYGTVDCEGVAG